MVSDPSQGENPLRLAAEGRDEASLLLRHLLRDRRHAERHLNATGKDDPLRLLTGRSALDRAIDSTRALIRDVDGLLQDLEGTVGTNGSTRNGTANHVALAAAIRGDQGAAPTVAAGDQTRRPVPSGRSVTTLIPATR